MSKVLVSEENLTNIANSIRSKLDVETTYKLGQMSAAIDSIETGGGLEINGKKENFIASYNSISSGDLVAYRHMFGGVTDESMVSIQNAARNITTVALDENRVFVTYLKLHNTSKNYYGIYGAICTIDGTTVTSIGEEVTLFTPAATGYHIVSAVKLGGDKVFIARSNSSNTYPTGIVCTIDGSTITVGTSTTLVSNYSTNISVSRLTYNKVFIAYATSSSYKYLNGIVCDISGTTIAPGTATELVETAGAGAVISAVCLHSTRVFIAHSSDATDYKLNGIVCDISGTTITAGTDTTLVSTTNSANSISIGVLSTTKVVISHFFKVLTSYNIGVKLCTISGTTATYATITVSSMARIEPSSYSTYKPISIAVLNANKVCVIYPDTKYDYLCKAMCTIPGSTEIIVHSSTSVQTSGVGAVFSSQALNENTIFIAHSSDTNAYFLNGRVEKQLVKTVTSSDSNYELAGVANADIPIDTLGEVWVPNV